MSREILIVGSGFMGTSMAHALENCNISCFETHEAYLATIKKLNYEELSVTGYHEPSLVFLAKGKIILSDPNEAAIFLAEGNNNLVLVEGRELDEFINSSLNLNLKLKKIREIKGFNYSKGQNIKILFFKVAK